MGEERRLRTICPRASAMVRSSASGASFCCAVSIRSSYSVNTMESSIYVRSTSHFDVFVDVGVGLVEKSSVSPGRWREEKNRR